MTLTLKSHNMLGMAQTKILDAYINYDVKHK